MYKCPNCECIYDEPRRVWQNLGWFDHSEPMIDTDYECPICSEPHHPESEVFECERCGEYFRKAEITDLDDGRALCDNCVGREYNPYTGINSAFGAAFKMLEVI